MWRKDERYKADRIGKRAEPWPTPTFTSKDGEVKLFQK